MSTEPPPTADESLPYGTRFLNALRLFGMPTSFLKYDELQRLKVAERDEAITILRGKQFGLTYAQIQQLKRLDPEAAAERFAIQAQLAAQQAALLFLMF